MSHKSWKILLYTWTINMKENITRRIIWRQLQWYYRMLTDCFWCKYCYFPHWISVQYGVLDPSAATGMTVITVYRRMATTVVFIVKLYFKKKKNPITFSICRIGYDFQEHGPTVLSLYISYPVKSSGPFLGAKNSSSAPIQPSSLNLWRKHVTYWVSGLSSIRTGSATI